MLADAIRYQKYKCCVQKTSVPKAADKTKLAAAKVCMQLCPIMLWHAQCCGTPNVLSIWTMSVPQVCMPTCDAIVRCHNTEESCLPQGKAAPAATGKGVTGKLRVMSKGKKTPEETAEASKATPPTDVTNVEATAVVA